MLAAAWYLIILLVVGSSSSAFAFAESPRWPRRLSGITLATSVLLLVVVAIRLWSQTYDAFGGDEPLTFAHAGVILFDTSWGTGWLWQAGAVSATFVAACLWRGRWQWWPLVTCSGIAVGLTTALTGHAMGMPDQVWVTVPAHGLHVAAAGAWLGALVVVLIVTSGARFDVDVQARLAFARVIDRFSPVAFTSSSMLVAAGVIATWQHVIAQAGLEGFASPYGLAVLGKVAAFGAAALCGLYNWRVLRPQLSASEDAVRQLRLVAWLEVSLGLVAVVLTAVLGTLSMPEPPGGAGH